MLSKIIKFYDRERETERLRGWNIVEEPMEKKELVQWHNEDRKEKFLVVSKAGFTKKCMEGMRDNARGYQ